MSPSRFRFPRAWLRHYALEVVRINFVLWAVLYIALSAEGVNHTEGAILW